MARDQTIFPRPQAEDFKPTIFVALHDYGLAFGIFETQTEWNAVRLDEFIAPVLSIVLSAAAILYFARRACESEAMDVEARADLYHADFARWFAAQSVHRTSEFPEPDPATYGLCEHRAGAIRNLVRVEFNRTHKTKS